MYLHLGQAVVVPGKDVVGIFDLDNASWSYKTREFLERAEKEGRVTLATADLPRSFLICRGKGQTTKVYLSQLTSATLKGRMEGNGLD